MIQFWVQSLALLLLRVGFGGMMLAGHGLRNVMNVREISSFPDPLGLGSFLSLMLAIFAQFFCAVLLMLGIGTRLAAIPLVIAMLIKLAVAQSSEPWAMKELTAAYLVAFVTILVAGGGGFSLDRFLWRRRMKSS
jgi:putative oxidoreductase